MKKYVIMLMLSMFSLFTYAQSVMWFKTTEFAFRVKEYGTWSDWSDWQRSSMKVKIDKSRDVIVIYSNETQIYKVIEILDPPYDPKGEQVAFRVIDQDLDYGRVRLRVENNGNCQIYVDFNDLSWVYNVVRIE